MNVLMANKMTWASSNKNWKHQNWAQCLCLHDKSLCLTNAACPNVRSSMQWGAFPVYISLHEPSSIFAFIKSVSNTRYSSLDSPNWACHPSSYWLMGCLWCSKLVSKVDAPRQRQFMAKRYCLNSRTQMISLATFWYMAVLGDKL